MVFLSLHTVASTLFLIASALRTNAAAVEKRQLAPVLDPVLTPVTNVVGGVTPIKVNLGARVLAGDPTCPAVVTNGINTRVFAAVTLAETASVTALGVETADVTATVKVCLCVNAGVSTNLINVPAYVNAEAIADIQAAANAGVSAPLLTTLNNGGVLNVNLQPVGSTQCTCAANQVPGCINGGCTCTNCPAGQFYSATRGMCVVSPSPLARARARARSGMPEKPASPIQQRQARRADVVKRTSTKADAGKKAIMQR